MSTKTKNIAPKDFDLLNQKVNEISDEVKQLSKHSYEHFLAKSFPIVTPDSLSFLKKALGINLIYSSIIPYEVPIASSQGSFTLDTAIRNYNVEDKDLDIVTKIFFRSNKSIIDTIFKNTDASSDLCYFILLKSDTESNRNQIFAFYDSFEFVTNISKVFFQFVPPSLKEYFKNNKKEISLT